MKARTAEDGSATTELVLLTPVLLLLLAFVVFTGRVSDAEQRVLAAADEAARAASLWRDAATAEIAATEAAGVNLANAGVSCEDLTVDVDTSAFRRGGYVSVTVMCGVGLDDVAFAGVPGERRLTATATEVIDTFRGGS